MIHKTSEQLAQFLDFLRSSSQGHKYYSTLLLEVEKSETDLMHFIELGSGGYRERCKISTKLRKCLLERRAIKDRIEELAPLADFLAEQQNKSLMDKLSHILGETRKAERYHANRSYKPRVLPTPTTNSISERATIIHESKREEDNTRK